MSIRIAISGATGFVGSALGKHLSQKSIHIRGLTRRINSKPSWAHEWMTWDPMNIESIRIGLEGMDAAVYLVHSMMAPAIYTQGRFSDLDRLLAHNFAKAAKINGIKKIIYLGGIIPKDENTMSEHLASRREVESILRIYGTPVISLRAGVIVGPGGPSLDLLLRVVKRFPIMICPYWTQSLSAPIDLTDLLHLLEYALTNPNVSPGHYDVGGKEALTYLDMMKIASENLGLKRLFLKVPFFYESASALIVSVCTQLPFQLVCPLLYSLRHTILPSPNTLIQAAGIEPKGFTDSLKLTLQNRYAIPEPIRLKCRLFEKKFSKRRLCSVQTYTMPLNAQHSAKEMSLEYAKWLGQLIPNLLRIIVCENGDWKFFLGKLRKPLMILKPNFKYLEQDFIQFTISEGLLVSNTKDDPGRMEFHIIRLDNAPPKLIIGVMDFCSPLPWILYRCTQAQIHKVIMILFKIHLYFKFKPL